LRLRQIKTLFCHFLSDTLLEDLGLYRHGLLLVSRYICTS